MNKDNANIFLPIVKALAEGKVIQIASHHNLYIEWCDCTGELAFDKQPDQYHIKPEPQYRPWKSEEVPLGIVVHDKEKSLRRVFIAGVDETHVHSTLGFKVDFEFLLKRYTQNDGSPCGVPVDLIEPGDLKD